MSDIQECKTSRLSWAVASNLIGNRVSEILGHTVDCNAIPDSYDYWSTGLLGYRMPLSELHYLSETMHLDDSEIAESLPDCDEKADSVDCFGMALLRALLKSKIGGSWENESWNDNYLWLIESPETMSQPHICIGHCTVSMESLKSKSELIKWLTEHGTNHRSSWNSVWTTC